MKAPITVETEPELKPASLAEFRGDLGLTPFNTFIVYSVVGLSALALLLALPPILWARHTRKPGTVWEHRPRRA